MPRKAREGLGTGIFHVMMRGINHQNIFEDAEDNDQFINTLDSMRVRYDDDGMESCIILWCMGLDRDTAASWQCGFF